MHLLHALGHLLGLGNQAQTPHPATPQQPLPPSPTPNPISLPMQGSSTTLQSPAFAPAVQLPHQPGFVPDHAGAFYVTPGDYGTGYDLNTGLSTYRPAITPRAFLKQPNFPIINPINQ